MISLISNFDRLKVLIFPRVSIAKFWHTFHLGKAFDFFIKVISILGGRGFLRDALVNVLLAMPKSFVLHRGLFQSFLEVCHGFFDILDSSLGLWELKKRRLGLIV
jgi:hypothetical protein